MCIRDSHLVGQAKAAIVHREQHALDHQFRVQALLDDLDGCLLYTSDAADERSSVDLGGRRIIKKKNR